MSKNKHRVSLIVIVLMMAFAHSSAIAQSGTKQKKQETNQKSSEGTTETKKTPAKEPAPIELKLAGGKLIMTAPGKWHKVQPRSNMIETEFSIDKSENDPADGRLTIMGAGGSVKANIDRWQTQFTGAKQSKVTESTIAGQKVHMVDIQGTFKESMRGPMGPSKNRENYRMLAAIIVTKSVGQYFVKLTGPKATLEANKKAFEDFIKSMVVK